MVHAPEAEGVFMEEGYGVNRRHFAVNDFVIVGPKDDPAGLSRQRMMRGALRALAGAKIPFFSRGDDSGTHKKELSLWKGAGLSPVGPWYREVGQGMGPTLLMASETQGYALTDRGTFLSLEEKLDLVVVYEGGRELENPYHIIAVCPQRYPHVRYVESMMLVGWVTSPEGQEIIGSLTRRGRQLFTPRLGVCPTAP
jgi:tungstate transport system substrate-binding protein